MDPDELQINNKPIIGKEYPLVISNINEEILTLQYLFKPSTIDNQIPGYLKISSTNEVEVQLSNSESTTESFKGNLAEKTTGEFALVFQNNQFILKKVTKQINNLKHTRNEDTFGKVALNNTNKSKNSMEVNKILKKRKLNIKTAKKIPTISAANSVEVSSNILLVVGDENAKSTETLQLPTSTV